ncbi:MAG: YegP family protein, partial [Glaciimonas sp.]|nr:YegP family protein [Glaciimonas sp.]
YFTLKAANHEVIGTSQMYDSVETRDNGIASVKANGATDTIKNET